MDAQRIKDSSLCSIFLQFVAHCVENGEPILSEYSDGGKDYALTLAEWQAATGKDEGSVVEAPRGIEIDRENKRITVKAK